MKRKEVTMKQQLQNGPLICLVCGDIARGMNFDVMTCMSCKIFFRRHAPIVQFQAPCQRRNNCIITKMTRRSCSYCRLNKCFSLGMNPLLIRNWSNNQLKLKHGRSFHMTQIDQQRLPNPSPLNLLNNDSSSLTTDEWNLLSNVIHCYDAANIMPKVKSIFDEQSKLLPKLRSKTLNSMSVLTDILSTAKDFITRCSYYHDLPIDIRQTLVYNNAEIFCTTNTSFILRELNALENTPFPTICTSLYGNEITEWSKSINSRLEPNGVLVKVMILILGFSTNGCALTYDRSKIMSTLSNKLSTFHIQNILVTMLWKYLNYQYGFKEAVRCFNSFIRLTIFMLQSAYDMRNVNQEKLMDTLVDETKRSLTIKNEG